MHFADIHWVALFTSVLIYMIVGAVWYSPFLFGETWRNALGYRPEKMTPSNKAWIGAFLNAIVTALGLSVLIRMAGASTGLAGVEVAFFAWLGISATGQFGAVLWENRPVRVFLIHAGCMLVTLLLMGFVLGGF